MAIFLVLALKDSSKEKIRASISRLFADDHYEVADDKWFVNSDTATARQLAEKIGIIGPEPLSGLIVSVAGYSGRAQPDLWEWLAAKVSTSDAR